jgi:hypothetical protein
MIQIWERRLLQVQDRDLCPMTSDPLKTGRRTMNQAVATLRNSSGDSLRYAHHTSENNNCGLGHDTEGPPWVNTYREMERCMVATG